MRTLAAATLVAATLAAPIRPAIALTGDADTTWMTNHYVFATARWGDVLFVGGRFTQVRELPPGTPGGTVVTVANLAAFDVSTGAAISTFHPLVTASGDLTAQVRALAVRDGTLYVGGQFGAVDGQPHHDLAAIRLGGPDRAHLTGTVIGTFRPTVGVPGSARDAATSVYTMLAGRDGLTIGGSFTGVNGTPRAKVARVRYADGSLDRRFEATDVNGAVRDMIWARDRETIFVAGAFSRFDGRARQSIVRIGTDRGALAPWRIPPGDVVVGPPKHPGMSCWSLAATKTRLFAGCGRGPNYAAAFHLDHGHTGDRSWFFHTVGNVQAVRLMDGGRELAIGGHFGTALPQKVCGDRFLKNLGILRAVGGGSPRLDCTFLPQFSGVNSYGGVWTIQVTPAYLWVGGEFQHIGSAPHFGLARFTR